MAAVATLDAYRSRAERVLSENPGIILGSLLWYSITEGDDPKKAVPVRVKPEDLEKWVFELGLNPKHLPAQLSRVNAFRRGSTEISHRYQLDEKRWAMLRTVEITYDRDQVLRHVLRDVTDTSATTTSTCHVATLRFQYGGRSAASNRAGNSGYKATILEKLIEIGIDDNKPTGRKFPLPLQDRREIDLMLGRFHARYTDLAEHLQSQALRDMVRKYLVELNAVMCKPSGGVYFAHVDHQGTINALQELLRRIGQGCQLTQVPLIDTPDYREMVTDALAKTIEGDCRRLLASIAEVNERTSNGKVAPKDFAAINDKYQRIVDRVEDYTNKLGIAQAQSGASLELALDGIADLSTRLDAKAK